MDMSVLEWRIPIANHSQILSVQIIRSHTIPSKLYAVGTTQDIMWNIKDHDFIERAQQAVRTLLLKQSYLDDDRTL